MNPDELEQIVLAQLQRSQSAELSISALTSLRLHETNQLLERIATALETVSASFDEVDAATEAVVAEAFEEVVTEASKATKAKKTVVTIGE